MFNGLCLQVFKSNENVISDNGFHYHCSVRSRNVPPSFQCLHATMRARQETLSKSLKMFKVLKSVFRHTVYMQATSFHAVGQICQLW